MAGMEQKKPKINAVCAERIKAVLKNERVTQAELSRRIGQTPQNVNRIINLKQPLIATTARDIANAFPKSGYRIEWLMGDDDVATQRDAMDSLVAKARKRHDDVVCMVIALARAAKIDVRQYAGGMLHENGAPEDDFIVRDANGVESFATYSELEGIARDLQALAGSELTRLLEARGRKGLVRDAVMAEYSRPLRDGSGEGASK